ncbi:MAG: PAAR domain-containing protein [Fulvivirga sp.]
MGQPAARIMDMHICPMSSGNVPHVGGPIGPMGSPNVNIGGLSAARVNDTAQCTGGMDQIIMGSSTVNINNFPAARMGDSTAHGGQILQGCLTVNIG